jgi:hypothetical protein
MEDCTLHPAPSVPSVTAMCQPALRGSIAVREESDAVALNYRADSSGSGEWKSVQQRVPIRLTACHLSGQRPWLLQRPLLRAPSGHPLWRWQTFACRRCYGLSYANQQQTALHRGLEQAWKIRMRLGGSADLLEPFPAKPKGMHRRTFQRLRARAEAAVLIACYSQESNRPAFL